MKKTLIALGAFAVLLIAVLATREKDVSVGVPKLTLAPMGDVTGIEVSGPVQAKLVKENGKWLVGQYPADEAQVKSALDLLKDFKADDFVTEKAERHAELQVDDQKGTKVQFTTATGAGWSLLFGTNAKPRGFYVRDPKSNAVFVTQSYLGMQLKKSVSQWRDKVIATAPAADITKLVIARGGESMTLSNVNGQWELEPKPAAPYRFDAVAAGQLVQQLGMLRAQDFTDDASIEADATLTATLKDGKRQVLTVSKKRPDGNALARLDGNPQTYVLAGWSVDQLIKSQDDLRDRTLLSFDTDKVARVSIINGAKSTVLVKDKDSWRVLEPKKLPDGFELDPAQVSQTLVRLRGLRGTKVVTGLADAAAGLGKPSLALEVQLTGGAKQTVRLGNTVGNDVYAKGANDALTYALPLGEKQWLETGVELFKKRPPPDMNQIRGLDQLPPEIRKQLEAQLRQGTH